MSDFLMRNISWALGRRKYETYEEFAVNVTSYNDDMYRETGLIRSWNQDEEVSKQSIRVVYEAGWKDEDDTIDIEIGEDGKSLTMGKLLFSLNNETYYFFKDANHCFFEGLELINNNKYKLRIGS